LIFAARTADDQLQCAGASDVKCLSCIEPCLLSCATIARSYAAQQKAHIALGLSAFQQENTGRAQLVHAYETGAIPPSCHVLTA
jgi:hypothetical protein